MSGLINNPNKIIERKPILKPANEFTMADLNTPEKPVKKAEVKSVTYSSSVRMDNHIKNQLQAMTLIGVASTQQDAIDRMLVEWRNHADEDTLKMFDLQVSMLEKKDALQYANKK